MSNFSFLEGASHAAELVERARDLGYAALAITDECSLAGVVRAHAAAKDSGLQLILGAHFHLQTEQGMPDLHLLLLAQNRNGYGNLAELISLARSRAEKADYRLYASDIAQPATALQHLRAMPDCVPVLLPEFPACAPSSMLNAHAGLAVAGLPDVGLAELRRQAAWVKQVFGARAWLGVTNLLRAYEDLHQAALEQVAQEQDLPLVALGQVVMHRRSRKPLQDMLCALRLKQSLPECGFALAPNAEQHLRPRLRLGQLFSANSLAATIQVAQSCTFSLNELRYHYPQEVVPPGHTPASWLHQAVMQGAAQRYPQGVPAEVSQQLRHELELIADLGYEAYFLTVYDIVCFARSVDILCQGRGSAANSAVCYCLGITEVDPARGNLLFERFISRERNEAPDIDVDFEHQRREEVMQYIYRKYGRKRAALAATVICYRPRSALRDAGRALGVDQEIIDKVCSTHRWFDSSQDLLPRLEEAGLNPDAPQTRLWAQMAQNLLGFPRHLSQHVGGFVIARDQLSRLVPIENAAMPERTVIQWDKDDLEELGLMKVDILALGMLSALRRALLLVGQQRGSPFRLQDIPAEDPATYDMLCRAETMGVFQVESRAQMSMLPRLRPRQFYDLVVEVALVRPGPIQGGMVHPYLRRRQGLEPVVYPSEKIRTALQRTLGVPIFQEQVMQIAMLAADFSAGEADQLRRSMAAWKRRGSLQHYYQKITEGMARNGYPAAFAEQIFAQIQGFAEYGFPESHAASFALLVYASAWLKCHHPAAFLCALLNSQPLGFYSPAQLVQEARRQKVLVAPVDVMCSEWESTLEALPQPHQPAAQTAPRVRLGLSRLSGLRQEAGKRIAQARQQAAFVDVHDLAMRADLNQQDLQALAAGNALVSLAGHRRHALWQAVGARPDKDLLRHARLSEVTPVLPPPNEAQEIVADYASLGLTLGRHPLALLRPQLLAKRFLCASDLADFQDAQLARAAGIVTVRQRPPTAKGVLFMTLEDESGNLNVIVWPALLEKQRQELLSARLLGVYGVWQRNGAVCHLVAKRVLDLSHLLGQLQAGSRDFF